MEAILLGLAMNFVMTSITMKTADMMMETAVDCQPKKTFAMNVHARVSWNQIAIAKGHVLYKWNSYYGDCISGGPPVFIFWTLYHFYDHSF